MVSQSVYLEIIVILDLFVKLFPVLWAHFDEKITASPNFKLQYTMSLDLKFLSLISICVK